MKQIIFAGILLALLSFAFISKADRTITGTVKDQNGDLVPFATITIKQISKSVTADANGFFRITIDDEIKTIEITAVGIEAKQVQLTAASNYNIVVKRTQASMSDVVVTTALRAQKQNKSPGYSLQGS